MPIPRWPIPRTQEPVKWLTQFGRIDKEGWELRFNLAPIGWKWLVAHNGTIHHAGWALTKGRAEQKAKAALDSVQTR